MNGNKENPMKSDLFPLVVPSKAIVRQDSADPQLDTSWVVMAYLFYGEDADPFDTYAEFYAREGESVAAA